MQPYSGFKALLDSVDAANEEYEAQQLCRTLMRQTLMFGIVQEALAIHEQEKFSLAQRLQQIVPPPIQPPQIPQQQYNQPYQEIGMANPVPPVRRYD